MWKESDKKIVVHLQPSLALAVLLVLQHIGGWLGILLVPLPWYAQAVLAVAVGASLKHSLNAHALRRGPNAVCTLELQADVCAVRFAAMAAWTDGELVDAFVHPWLVILRLRLTGRRWTVPVVILRSATDGEIFRALRVQVQSALPRGKAVAEKG